MHPDGTGGRVKSLGQKAHEAQLLATLHKHQIFDFGEISDFERFSVVTFAKPRLHAPKSWLGLFSFATEDASCRGSGATWRYPLTWDGGTIGQLNRV